MIFKELRKAKNLSQEKLASLVGVTQGAVSQWEKGLTHPRYETIPRLAIALDCSADELVKQEKKEA